MLLSRRIALVLGAAIIAGAGSAPLSSVHVSAARPAAAMCPMPPAETAIPMNQLIACAKKEGMVHGYGYDHTWAHEIALYTDFSKKYGIQFQGKAEELWTSAQELGHFLSEQDKPVGDVAEVGLKWGPVGSSAGAYAVYRNTHWNALPAYAKSPDGTWACPYYGAIGLEVNTDKVKNVPQHWNDLLKPEYKGLVAVDDPLGSNQGVQSVLAVNYGLGGSLDNISPAIKFFAQLKKSGNWLGTRPLPGPIASGEAAISLRWSYNALSDTTRKGYPRITVVVPTEGTVAGPYCEVINKLAPHPYAARLAVEWLFSDEGQTSYATGYAFPLVKGAKLPAAIAKALPPLPKKVAVYTDATKLVKASTQLTSRWTNEVLGQ